MKDRFDQAQIEFIVARWNRTPLNLTLDLNTLSLMSFTTDRLMSTVVVFRKCLVNMKCMSLAAQIALFGLKISAHPSKLGMS